MPPRKFKKKGTSYRKKKTSYRARRYPSRKTGYRRRSSYRIVPNVRVHRPIARQGIPQILNTKLAYVWSKTLTCAALAVMSTQRFRMASIYDPDLSGTGSQPYMRDQIMPLYTYYLVYGCKIDITISSCSPSNDLIQFAFTIDGDGNPPPTDFEYIQEIPYVAQRQLPGTRRVFYKRYVNIAKAAAIPKMSLFTDSAYLTTANANPSLIATALTCAYRSTTSNTPTFLMNVRLTYYVQFSSLITQAQS